MLRDAAETVWDALVVGFGEFLRGVVWVAYWMSGVLTGAWFMVDGRFDTGFVPFWASVSVSLAVVAMLYGIWWLYDRWIYRDERRLAKQLVDFVFPEES